MTHSVCKQCGHVLLMTSLLALEKPLCPKCGNKYFTMKFHCSLEFLPHGSTRVKQKGPYHKSDKKLRREHFVGMEANKDGGLMVKERLIDKDADVYYEYVRGI